MSVSSVRMVELRGDGVEVPLIPVHEQGVRARSRVIDLFIQRYLATPNITKRSLTEFAVTAIGAGVCCPFVENKGTDIPIIITLIGMQMILNTISRVVDGHIQQLPAILGENQRAVSERKNRELMQLCCKEFAAISFALATAGNTVAFLHELGHLTAGYALWENIDTSITLQPFVSGLTSIYYRSGSPEPTELGSKMSQESRLAILSGAGPLLQVTLCVLLLGLGIAKKRTCPELSRTLRRVADWQFLSSALYALTAVKALEPIFGTPNSHNDFYKLVTLKDIDPLIAGIALAVIPLLMHAISRTF